MIRRPLAIALALVLSTAALAHEGDEHDNEGRDRSRVMGGLHADEGEVVGDLDTVNGGISIEDRATAGSIETVNGGIRTDFFTKVGGDVSTVNGGITVRQTDVGGRISMVNGNITIGNKSHVHGGILVEKNKGIDFGWGSRKPKLPRIVIGPNAIVDGELRFERKVDLYVHTTAKIGKVIGATPVAYTDTIPERE
jgi:hypothetical protein